MHTKIPPAPLPRVRGLAFLGFPPAMIAIQKGISLVYQFWIHTEAIGRMPRWFEAVFNTPSHHRVHHARNPRYLDRNYAQAVGGPTGLDGSQQ